MGKLPSALAASGRWCALHYAFMFAVTVGGGWRKWPSKWAKVGGARCQWWLPRLQRLGVVGTSEWGQEIVCGYTSLHASAVQLVTRRGQHGESWTRLGLLSVRAVGGRCSRLGQRHRGLNALGVHVAGPDHNDLGCIARSGPWPDKTLCHYSIIFPISSNATS
jgi:hypothetical protein